MSLSSILGTIASSYSESDSVFSGEEEVLPQKAPESTNKS